MKKRSLSIDVAEITLGQFPPELTITFTETIRSVDLNKIVLRDIKVPDLPVGLKIEAVEAT